MLASICPLNRRYYFAMKTKSLFFALVYAACLMMLCPMLQAQTIITFSNNTFYGSGSFDDLLFDGATWTISFESSQTTYENNSGYAVLYSDTVTLTVTGASDDTYNTTETITNFGGDGDLSFMIALNSSNSIQALVSNDFTEAVFFFQGLEILDFYLEGVNPNTAPSPGDPVQASDFTDFSVDGSFETGISTATIYGINSDSAFEVTVIPEPTSASVLGLALAYWAARRRSRR